MIAPVERIEAARGAALDALTRATAGQTLCTLGRDRLDAAKYHEGAVAALSDARRSLRRGAPPPTPEDWGAGSAETRAQVSASWRAYLVGGRDALTAVYRSTLEDEQGARS